MKKHNLREPKAKNISNIIKILIVAFIFFNYMYQSKTQGSPLSSDQAKSLLFIAIAGFMILLPIDGSIFIKNLKRMPSKELEELEELNEIKTDNKKDLNSNL